MVYFSMKRGREDDQINESITTMANYLLLLSQANNLHDFDGIMIGDSSPTAARVFECKTCNRQFSSFQALGGHRASHKKPRVMLGGSNINDQDQEELLHAKPKVHECSICGLEFALGQALGGHMRRHKGGNDGGDVKENIIPVVKKPNSRRIVCLDLNLTPLENDLEFQVGKTTNAVDNFV